MIIRTAVVAALALSTPSCVGADPSPEPTASTPVCENATADLRLVPGDQSAAARTLSWNSAPQGSSFRWAGVRLAEGRCAASLQAFVMDNLLLVRDLVVTADDHGAVRPLGNNGGFDQAMLAPAEATQLSPAGFAGGYRAAYVRRPEGLVTYFVGVWPQGSGSVVRAFGQMPGGRFTAPVEVLRSTLPLRSVTYFPAPDTQAGRLGLVQETGGYGVRLIGLDWSHPGLFR